MIPDVTELGRPPISRRRWCGASSRFHPFAYVWDWYTLEVGVFAIPMRTGVELLGIPLEEHIFMLVVPAMIVGTHETIRTVDSD